MKRTGILFVLSLVIGCNSWDRPGERAMGELVMDLVWGEPVRSASPDPLLVSDINLLIYNEEGLLEERRYFPARSFTASSGNARVKTTLLTEAAYDIFIAANLGYALPALGRQEVETYRFHMAYPDEYSHGMPMCARLDGFISHGESSVTVPLVRTMARIDLRLDRSKLRSDVSFQVTSVTVGNGPSSVCLFGDSRAESASQVFQGGFTLSGQQVQPLNIDETVGRSGAVSLYLLENLQGDLLDTEDEREKTFAEGRYPQVCSYLEIKGSYHSDVWHTRPGETVSYRFYLGDGPGNFDIYRNTACEVTVCLEGDGLSEEGWRVDKGELVPETRFDLHPAAYNECQPGDDYRIWCDVFPEDTPFEIDPVAWDDDEGVHNLYTYDIDPDGHGITLHTWKGGSALVYFKAGPPVNRDTLALLVIGP